MTLKTYNTYLALAVIVQVIVKRRPISPNFNIGNVNSLGMSFRKVTHLILQGHDNFFKKCTLAASTLIIIFLETLEIPNI
jgi:hypothetical protein